LRKLLIVTLVALAACGGGGSESSSTTAATGTTAATDYVLIQITALEFPAETVIPAGKSVAWQNQMLVLHQIVMESHDGAPVDDIDPIPLTGDAIHELALEPGTWTYFCSLHPQMTGSLTVEG
jgi:plastocyanin